MSSGDRRVSRALRVCAVGAPWRPGQDTLPYEHELVDSIKDADAVFLWLGTQAPNWLTIFEGLQLGEAMFRNRPVYEAHLHGDRADWVTTLLQKLPVQGGTVARSAREAYDNLMADLDVTMTQIIGPRTATATGWCDGCRSSYRTGDPIMISDGFFHPDCYARRKDPVQADAALFHAGLTEALRKDNARLEQRVAELELQARPL